MALLLSCLICSMAYAQDSIAVPDDEEDIYFLLMGDADEAIKEEKFEEAAARLIEAMGVRPDSPTNVLLLSNLGMVYSYMGRDSLAITTLDKAHEIAPRMVTVLVNRANISMRMGRDKDAYNDFAQVIRLDSINPAARYYHGMMALYAGKQDTARRDFEVLESVNGDGVETLIAMSTLNAMTGDNLTAIKYYKRLIEKEPSPEFYASLAGCYLATEQLTEASEVLAKAMKLYPDDPELFYYRAWLNRDRYLLDDARQDGRRAVALGADPAKVNSLFSH